MTRTEQLRVDDSGLSGRYVYNGGVGVGRGGFVDAHQRPLTSVELDDPMHALPSPVFVAPAAVGRAPDDPAVVLYVDIDGTDPLGVVSGDVAGVGVGAPEHFIGRVVENLQDGVVRRLTVADFRLTWPDTGEVVDHLEIAITGGNAPSADVAFVVSGGTDRHGPFRIARESAYFRQVEIEVDVEEGAVAPEPYDTATHPVRPAGVPTEILTIERAFAKSGISIVRSPNGNKIATEAAGANRRWNSQELHDAMESHWSSFANRPQWKLWVFVAALADSDSLGGIMFDGNVREPGVWIGRELPCSVFVRTSTPRRESIRGRTHRPPRPPSVNCSSTSSMRAATRSTWPTHSRSGAVHPGPHHRGCPFATRLRPCRS